MAFHLIEFLSFEITVFQAYKRNVTAMLNVEVQAFTIVNVHKGKNKEAQQVVPLSLRVSYIHYAYVSNKKDKW